LVTKTDLLKNETKRKKIAVDAAKVFDNPAMATMSQEELEPIFLREAEIILQEALDIYPTYLNAVLLMGNTKYKLNDDVDEAKRYYDLAIKMKPNYFEGNFNLGTILSEKKRYRQAIPYLKKAIKSKPQKYEAYHNLGNCYFWLDNPDSAFILYKIHFKGTNGPDDRLASGFAYYKIGQDYGKVRNNLQQAIYYITKAVEQEPENATYYNDLGVAFGMAQDFQKALGYFEKMLELDPKAPNGNLNIGNTYMNLAMQAEAAGDAAGQQQYKQKADEYFAKANASGQTTSQL